MIKPRNACRWWAFALIDILDISIGADLQESGHLTASHSKFPDPTVWDSGSRTPTREMSRREYGGRHFKMRRRWVISSYRHIIIGSTLILGSLFAGYSARHQEASRRGIFWATNRPTLLLTGFRPMGRDMDRSISQAGFRLQSAFGGRPL